MFHSPLTQPVISIVVPVFNGGESFKHCLATLRAWGSRAEVIVVADGESDDSWKWAEESGFRVIRLPVSGGPAKARNIGAQAATTDILFFIDADVEIHPTTVQRVIYAFEQHPEVVALIGSYDDAPGAENFLSQYKNLIHHYTHQDAKEEASTFWGACGAIRRDVFESLGGFNEGYRQPCVEDIELGYRLRMAGHRIRLCKYVQVKHLKHWTVYSLLRAEVFYRALPWMAMLLKVRQLNPQAYQAFTSDLNLQWSSRFSVMLVYAVLLCSVLIFWWPTSLIVIFVGMLALLLLNWPVYRFFYQKRGGRFTLMVLPWHWLYFTYSGLAYVIGTIRHWLSRRFSQLRSPIDHAFS